MWKHDFVTYYLYPEYTSPFTARRFRCPDCKTTFKCRPQGYLPRFFYPIKVIKKVLFKSPNILGKYSYMRETWHKRLKMQITACREILDADDLSNGFLKLLNEKIVPVSRSISSDIHPSFIQSTDRSGFQTTSVSDLLR